jgi:hypothetical protein
MRKYTSSVLISLVLGASLFSAPAHAGEIPPAPTCEEMAYDTAVSMLKWQTLALDYEAQLATRTAERDALVEETNRLNYERNKLAAKVKELRQKLYLANARKDK